MQVRGRGPLLLILLGLLRPGVPVVAAPPAVETQAVETRAEEALALDATAFGQAACVPVGGPPAPVAYIGTSTSFSFDVRWSTPEVVDLRFDIDYGDGSAEVQQVTDERVHRFSHRYDTVGQFSPRLTMTGTVDGRECTSGPTLLRSVVVTPTAPENLCVDRVASEVEFVAQVGERTHYTINEPAGSGLDYTLSVDWQPAISTDVRVLGPGDWAQAHDWTFPGVYRPVLSAQGVDADGPCTNPATTWAVVTVERRLSGPSRVETAVAVSRAAHLDGTAGGAVLARQDTYPDALAGGAAAAAVGGPLLLTASDQLHPASAAELQRVLPPGGTVHLLGGTAALSDAIAEQVAALGYVVRRLAGSGRAETAEVIARAMVPDPQIVLLATGGSFPDALLAGAVAARLGGAVLLTGPMGLAAGGRAYLADHPTAPVVVVGTAAAGEVGPAGVQGATVVAGADHYDTAVLLAERYPSTGRGRGLASGESFPDGLAGAALLALRDYPLLLTEASALPAVTAEHLREAAPMALEILGGPAAISVTASTAAREAASG